MKKQQTLTVKKAAVISDNVVIKKTVSNTSKANYGRKKERPTKSRRKKK